MKKKIFISLGLMSGTSMDGVDLSLIKSDGYSHIEQISDKYYEFDDQLHKDLISLRGAIKNLDDLSKYSLKINKIEKKFTLFNANIVNNFIEDSNLKPDFIGFHGQTIFHQAKDKISKQIGDAYLLSQLTKLSVVNEFRQKDLENNGQGAPLTPIFHYLISKKIKEKFNLKNPIIFINIGGITNVTLILNDQKIEKDLLAYDIAPGNCLIDEWLRKNSNKKFDNDGKIGFSGKVNKLILDQAIENFEILSLDKSLDINDFDISFSKGLSLEDGCSTLTEFTAHLISEGLKKIDILNNIKTKNYIFCGGGRKNKFLIDKINKFMFNKEKIFENIDKFQIDGDFVESQAFAYLAIRSCLKLPLSFPNTTRCNNPTLGGKIVKNF